MNEFYLIIEIATVFSLLLIVKKYFGRDGLMIWIPIATIIANIQVCKGVGLFGISATCGNVLFASNFLCTDILTECYSVKDAKKAVHLGLLSNVVYIVFTQLCLLYIPSVTDYANGAMQTLFTISFRTSIASLIMYYVSNMADVYLYEWIRNKTGERMTWLRNNLSTMLCNSLENFGFYLIAFFGIMSFQEMFWMFVSSSIIEILCALCDTPFLYIASRKERKKIIADAS